MAFLMLLHEKMRLQRKINKLTAKQLLASNRYDRATRQIERVQKMYAKKEKQIENAVKTGSSMFKAGILQQFGLGTQGMNPMSYGGGVSIFSQQGMASLAKECKVDPTVVQAVYMGQYSQAKDADGKPMEDSFTAGTTKIDKEQLQKIQYGLQCIRQQESMNSYCAQMAQTQYDQNISIWQEAAQAELEAEQDAALAPLYEQQTEWELEKGSIETQLTLAKEAKKNIEQELAEEAKDVAPKFGLG